MERCPIRIALTIACLCLPALASGCNSLGLGKGKQARNEAPAFYDEFFNEDDDELAAASPWTPGDAPAPRIFKRNRLPGGLSSEARAIEQGAFNIY